MELNSKKIAVLCNYALLPERVGGMDYFFWEFDTICKANAIEVDWYFPNVGSHGKYAEMNCINCQNEIESHFLNSNFQDKGYSHLITHFVELCTPFFYKVKKKSDLKIIAVDHNPRPLGGYSLKKAILKKLKGILFSRYIDQFIGVSNYTVNEIINDFGSQVASKSKTIYNGVVIDAILQRKTRNIIHPRFLVASHLRESKGIQDLIQAVSLLPIFIKEKIAIDVYGDGPYKGKLIQRIREHNLSNFDFKGSHPSLKTVYQEYDYLLQPTHMECFSLSILESLAANVPVITTAVGGNEEAVENGFNGYICEASKPVELSKIIEKVYLGEQSIAINTRELIANRFSLEKMVKEHFKIVC